MDLENKILELTDKIKDYEKENQDLKEYKAKYEEDISKYEEQLVSLRKTNRDYFERLVAEDLNYSKGQEIIKKPDNDESETGPVNWSDLVSKIK